MGLFSKMAPVLVCRNCGQWTKDNNRSICKYCGTPLYEQKVDKNLLKFGKEPDLTQYLYDMYIKGDPELENNAKISAIKESEELKKQLEWDRKMREARNTLRCPRCGSTAVVIGTRGYSMMTGFIGSGDTMNRCGNCGHKWKPRG